MFRLAARAAPRGRTAPVVVEGSKGVHSPAARLTVSMPPPRADAPLVYVNQESDVGSPVTGWRCPSSLSPCRNRRQRETERAHLAAHFPIYSLSVACCLRRVRQGAAEPSCPSNCKRDTQHTAGACALGSRNSERTLEGGFVAMSRRRRVLLALSKGEGRGRSTDLLNSMQAW